MPKFSSGYGSKATPADDDKVLIADSAAANAIKGTKISAIVAKAVAAVSAMTSWITTAMIQNLAVTAAKLDFDSFASNSTWDSGDVVLPVNGGSSGFTLYGAPDVLVRRRGKVVQVRGAVKPNHVTNSIGQSIVTLPEGMRPSMNFTNLNQGSGSASWNMTVQTNGNIVLERYNGTMATSSWLTFSVTFIAA